MYNGYVTHLHDCFEIETHTIPQSELTALGSREKPSSVRRPPYHVHRVFDLI